jgi:predicted AAA+ superfamily ATPase
MVVREEREGMVEMVGLWGNPVNQVPTEEEAQTEAVQIIQLVGQDAQEERILMRTARFISQEQENNVIQVHRIQ